MTVLARERRPFFFTCQPESLRMNTTIFPIMLVNILTLVRVPLALLFFLDSVTVRLLVIGLAMITDGLDGYLARRFNAVSRIGTILDPLTDRFFVVVCLSACWMEHKLALWGIITMFSRDIVLVLFMAYLRFWRMWKTYEVRATYWGKMTTFAQFCVIIATIYSVPLPWYVFMSFVVFTLFLVKELYLFYFPLNAIPHTEIGRTRP